MEKFYRICCAVMGVLALAALGVTLFVGFTGSSPVASNIGLIAVIVCLSLFAALTVLAVTLFKIGGRLPYRIGFYILHAGVVILLSGLIITELGTVTNRVRTVDAQGNEVLTGGDWFGVGQPVSSIPIGKKNLLNKGDALLLRDVKTEYYEDNGMPKHYEAELAVYDLNSGVIREEKTLTVNHPAYINGFKVYLMDMTGDRAALFIKYNPGEYVVLIGVALTVAGTFLACFSGFTKPKKSGTARDGGPSDGGAPRAAKGGESG